jgi:hypothetical protein
VTPQEDPRCNLSEYLIFIKSNCIGDFEQDEEDGYIREMNLNEKPKRAGCINRNIIIVIVRNRIKNAIKIKIN